MQGGRASGQAMAYPRPAMPSVTIREAAALLGVSTDTIRRRLARGELTGQQVHAGGRGGFTWYVDVPDADAPPSTAVVPAAPGDDLRQQVDALRAERDQLLARQDRLLDIIQTLAARPPAALPAGSPQQAKGRVSRAWDALRGR